MKCECCGKEVEGIVNAFSCCLSKSIGGKNATNNSVQNTQEFVDFTNTMLSNPNLKNIVKMRTPAAAGL